MTRIGIVGYGYLGKYIYDQIVTRPELGLEIAFVFNRSLERLTNIPSDHILHNIEECRALSPDLIIELAHPDVSRKYGELFLSCADYMPLSLTCLSDPHIEIQLINAAKTSGTRLCIAHGAVFGLDALNEGKDLWENVTITMRKPTKSIDFSTCQEVDNKHITKETILYDGPTRQICNKFPRNVNSHAATALAGIGFDRTRSLLIADPNLQASIIELEANGDGAQIKLQRTNPMQGVSGVLTLMSTLASICRTTDANKSSVFIC